MADGIHTREDVERLKTCGAKAVLIGESLMREDNIAAKVNELIGFRMSESLKVLIIEDSALDKKVLVGLVKAGGYVVTSERVETVKNLLML